MAKFNLSLDHHHDHQMVINHGHGDQFERKLWTRSNSVFKIGEKKHNYT